MAQSTSAGYATCDKLRLLTQRLVRHQFGRRSEQLSAEQLQLALVALEEMEQTVAANQAAQEAALPPSATEPKRRDTPVQRNLGELPAHLPRYEVLVDADTSKLLAQFVTGLFPLSRVQRISWRRRCPHFGMGSL